MCNQAIVTSMLVAGLMTTAVSAEVVWDNGPTDGVGTYRPSANWDPIGMIEDFDIPSHGYSAVNSFHIEMIDGTRGLGQPSVIDVTRIRLYGPLAGGISGVDIDNDTPVFDHTYTEASGEMVEIDSGHDHFGRDLVYFDCTGPVATLAAGHYGMFMTFPGINYGADSFWATSGGGPDGGDSETAGIIGPGGRWFDVNHHMAFRMEIPEPATLALLGLGSLALIRRR